MVPGDARSDVKRMNLLNNPCMSIVEYVQGETDRWVDSKVANQHEQQRSASLPTGKVPVSMRSSLVRAPKLHAYTRKPWRRGPRRARQARLGVCERREVGYQPMPRPRTKATWGTRPTIAFGRFVRRRLDPAFRECWHCGEQGHPRTNGKMKDRKIEYQKFAEPLCKYGGELPDDGASMKTCKQNGKSPMKITVKAVMESRSTKGV